MGQAKLRRLRQAGMVYHHTSILRTNLIWMSGVIQLEGNCPPVIHPEIGEIRTDALTRRAMNDFPRLAWFTTRINVPGCLSNPRFFTVDKTTGEQTEWDLGDRRALSNASALNRVALGFPIEKIPVVRWADHYGYATSEGRELNESAIEAGDDPADWYVSEVPVDLLESTEIYTSSSIMNPRLTRQTSYLQDVHRMVRACRENPGMYIMPTWMTEEQARKISARAGIPIKDGDQL